MASAGAPASSRPGVSRRRKWLFVAVVHVVLVTVAAFAVESYRAFNLYRTIKDTSAGWSDSLYELDPDLGYAPVPGAVGQIFFPEPPFADIHHDARGFRIPAADAPPDAPTRPLLLALGGSYTYGYGCAAEDTFPYLVADGLHGAVRNAGGAGYGLAQMLIQARRLIPEFRPDFVLAQYSPWLVERARHPFASADVGTVPAPFFAVTPDGGIELRPPVFPERVTELPTFAYRFTPAGAADFGSFLVSVGLPLLVYEDCNVLLSRVRGRFAGADMSRKVRHIDWPYRREDNDARERVVERVYEELERICRASGAQLVVVEITKYQPPERHMRILRALPNTIVVETTVPLYDRLPEPVVREYNKAYCHSRGTPPVFVDPHPNERAHRIIADVVLAAIRRAAAPPARRPEPSPEAGYNAGARPGTNGEGPGA